MNWAVTVPKTIRWEDYAREIDTVADRRTKLKYRVHRIPKELKTGDRMYIVWNGRVRGWMEIVSHGYSNGFTCQSTGVWWPAGYYIDRSGAFHTVEGPLMRGFQGVRKLPPFELKEGAYA